MEMKEVTGMQRAFIYARVSKDEEGSASLESQIQACREYCAMKNYLIVGEFTEVASAFAPANRRPVFVQMIERALQGECDVIVVWDHTRFSRLQEAAVLVKSQLNKHGIRVEYVKEPSFSDDITQRIYSGLMELFAEVESLQISARTKRGLENAIRKGHWCFGIPFGYKVVDKRLVPDDEKASVVRRLFTLAAQGYTIKEIAKMTNIPKSTVARILRSTVYAGEYVWRGIVIPTPPLVDKETFEKVQAMLTVRLTHIPRAAVAAAHPLAGLVFCECGSRCLSLTAKSGKYRYFVCRRRLQGECDMTFVNAALLEESLAAALFTSLQSIPTEQWEAVVNEEINVYVSDLKRLSESLLRREQALERKAQHLLALLPKTETAQQIIVAELEKIASEMREIKEERSRIENELTVLESSKKVLAEKILTFLDDLRTYETLDERERRMLMRAWVERVVIRKRDQEIYATATVRLFPTQTTGGRLWDVLRTKLTHEIAFAIPA